MPEYSDGSGSECSWSIVTNSGDLVDSDAFSISEHSDITVDDDLESVVDESDVEVHEEEGDNLSEDGEVNDDNDSDSEDSDESEDEEIGVVKENFEVVEDEEGLQDPVARFYANPALISKSFDELAEGKPCKWPKNLTVERQVQVLAFSALLATVFMGLVFGNIFTFDQCPTYHLPTEDSNFGVFNEKERLFSWKDDSQDDLVDDELPCEPYPEVKHQLSQCQRNLVDAMKSASGKATLVRYMRVHNDNLKSMLQKLQETGVKESDVIETEDSGDAPRPSEQLETSESPCSAAIPHPSNLQSAKPTKEAAPEFTTIPCEPKEISFLNLTRSLFEAAVSFANNTSLMLAESKDLARMSQIGKELTKWIGNKAMAKLPKTLENARSSWKIVMAKYVEKVSQALEIKKLHNLVKFRREQKSVNSSEKASSTCQAVLQCPATSPLVSHLNGSTAFKGYLTPKEHNSYISFLANIPPKQCYVNSTLLGCERCWWTEVCASTKKQCNLRRWQRQKRVDPKQFVKSDDKLAEIFKNMGWIPKVVEPVTPRHTPRYDAKLRLKKTKPVVKYGRYDAKEPRSHQKPRAQNKHRQPVKSTSSADWFMKRGAQRAALRRRHSSRFSVY